MSFFDRLERRCGWLAFPGFLRYYALFHVLIFVLQIFKPEIGQMFRFDRERVLEGEVWRVATMFFAESQFMGGNILISLLFLYFAVNFVFMISDGLEQAWGVFKTSLFYYTGIILILIASFVYPVRIPGAGLVLYGSAFLAFATLFPKVQILLMMIIPIQIRYLGMAAGFFILLNAFREPILFPFFLVGYANYLIWAAIPALRGTARMAVSVQRRRKFNAAKTPTSEAFHTCVTCKRTDLSDPRLEFRIGRDGEEYCVDHLPGGDK